MDGAWVEPASAAYVDIENPYTGEVWAKIVCGNADDANYAVKAARAAFEKPSEFTSASTPEFMELIAEAGFPQGRHQLHHRHEIAQAVSLTKPSWHRGPCRDEAWMIPMGMLWRSRLRYPYRKLSLQSPCCGG
ncbi:MAG: aldehyde dehydrogenase family protein [Geminicoccaceae bacterium]